MYFEPDGIYHVYNQGNNRQKIFFTEKNYLYFISKMRTHVLPYANVLAYCLMPNHFHLMIEVKEVALPLPIHGVTAPQRPGSHPVDSPRLQTLNTSIGVMLRSYTRAVNLQERRSGSLFREETKAICLNEMKGRSSVWYTAYGVTFLPVEIPEFSYLQTCFRYIHDNPVKAGLVDSPEAWEFSSYRETAGLREPTLVNPERVAALGLAG